MSRIVPVLAQSFCKGSHSSLLSSWMETQSAKYSSSKVMQLDISATDGIISGKMMRRLRKKQMQEALANDPNRPKEEKITLKQLRERCRELGLTDYGTKGVLQKRIEEKLASMQSNPPANS